MHWLMRLFAKRLPNNKSFRPHVRVLSLEECETRIVPATAVNYSTNWAGYAVTSTAGSVSGVSASWAVPSVTGSGAGYSSTWIGIDGYTSSSVEQVGVEADIAHGVPNYSAWYEMYPSSMVTVDLAVNAKDQVSASVTYSGGNFTLTITDANDPAGSNTFSITEPGEQFPRSSAEWIEEAPSSETSILPLANFGSVTFTKAQTTIDGVTGAISNGAWSNKVETINMVSGNAQVATASALSTDGASFTVTHGSVSTLASLSTTSPPTTGSPPTTTTSASTTGSPPSTTLPTTTSTATTQTLSPPTTSTHSPGSPPTLAGITTTPIPTTTRLSASGGASTKSASATLTAIVSSSVPVGTVVELFDNGSAIGFATVEDVNGLNEAIFTVTFSRVGTYTFTTEFLGAGQYEASTSATTTITVKRPTAARWVVAVSTEIDTPMKKAARPTTA